MCHCSVFTDSIIVCRKLFIAEVLNFLAFITVFITRIVKFIAPSNKEIDWYTFQLWTQKHICDGNDARLNRHEIFQCQELMVTVKPVAKHIMEACGWLTFQITEGGKKAALFQSTQTWVLHDLLQLKMTMTSMHCFPQTIYAPLHAQDESSKSLQYLMISIILSLV